MRVLEARFHPRKKSGEPMIVVGRIYCEGRQVRIQPAEAEATTSPVKLAMLDKLRYLVGTIGRPIFERLCELRSDYWSFVEVFDSSG
jgi:hypothetical protein